MEREREVKIQVKILIITNSIFSAFFTKKGIFCDILYSLDAETLQKGVNSLGKEIALPRSNYFLIGKGGRIKNDRVASPEGVPGHLKPI